MCRGPGGPRRGRPRRGVTGAKPAAPRWAPDRRSRAARGSWAGCRSPAAAPGRGGGAPRGGSSGSQPWGAAPAAHPAARALPAAGRGALPPPEPRAPALAPSLLVTSWAPAQINFLGIFKTAAARPLCAAACPHARVPEPPPRRRALNPPADLPARARRDCPGRCAGQALLEQSFARWGPPGGGGPLEFRSGLFFSPF